MQLEIDRRWDFADAAASEERFRDAADDDTHPAHERAVMVTQLARALGMQGRTDDALAVLETVSAIRDPDQVAEPLERSTSGERVEAADQGETRDSRDAAELRARVALERGRVLVSAGRVDDAMPELTRAVREAALAASAFLVLDSLHMLALHDAGHEAEWASEGFQILSEVHDPRTLRWSIALHHNLAWTLHDAGDPAAALAEFERGLAAAQAYGTADQRHIAQWSIARCLRSLDRLDEARSIQERLALERPDDRFVADELAALDSQSDPSPDTTPPPTP